VLGELIPSRLARLIAPEGAVFSSLPKADRRRVAEYIAAMPLEVTGDRGYSFAETTAGGVDLREVEPGTFESRRVRGLHIIGEMLDVDGRIGGFNFQWAWATGHIAGRAIITQLIESGSGN
jgi:predicted flavoprotein YhiN